jgi:hypothetical protein
VITAETGGGGGGEGGWEREEGEAAQLEKRWRSKRQRQRDTKHHSHTTVHRYHVLNFAMICGRGKRHCGEGDRKRERENRHTLYSPLEQRLFKMKR